MCVDIGYQILIQARVLLKLYRMLGFIGRPVQVEHKIADIVLDLRCFPIPVLMYLLNEVEDLGLDRVECDAVEVIYILLVDARLLHDVTVCGRDAKQLVAVILADPEDESLVVDVSIMYDRIMGDEGRNEHQVARGKGIFLVGDHHGHITVYKEVELIVVMSVTSGRIHMDIAVIVDLEILRKHVLSW